MSISRLFGLYMGGHFVKLVGVRTPNVARRAARHFSLHRHHLRRARDVSSLCLQSLAQASARAWVRRGGAGFSFLHAATVTFFDSCNHSTALNKVASL